MFLSRSWLTDNYYVSHQIMLTEYQKLHFHQIISVLFSLGDYKTCVWEFFIDKMSVSCSVLDIYTNVDSTRKVSAKTWKRKGFKCLMCFKIPPNVWLAEAAAALTFCCCSCMGVRTRVEGSQWSIAHCVTSSAAKIFPVILKITKMLFRSPSWCAVSKQVKREKTV